MNTNKLLQTMRSGWSSIVVIAVTTLAIIVISIYCLASGYFIIFQNLFYIPIIIACVYYTKRGFIFSVIIACLYFLLTIAFTRESLILLQALVRALIFVLVAVVITYLSLARKRVEESLRRQHDNLEGLVQERTAQLEEDSAKRKQAEEALRESEKQVRRKLDAILSPEVNIGALELSDIIDSEKIQKLMDQLYKVTHMGIGIIDLHGKVLVGTGWQDICTKFHRINPESCRLCIESDLELGRDVPVGTFNLYRCKNNMWDMSTPIKLGGLHMGNIFLGQFLFDDETVDYETFRQQARRYGFDEQEYIAALDRASRWSRQTVDDMMSFYSAFAEIIGNLSYANVKLAGALEDRKQAEDELRHLNEELDQQVRERTAELTVVNRELEAFSYSVSHDLRAPLRSVDGFAQMLEEDYTERLDDEGRRLLQVIRDSARDMGQLISDLLAFSRLSRKEMKMGRIGMSELAAEARRQVEQAETGRTIRWDLGELPPAFGDEATIREVLINLLANAVKYTRPRQEAVIGVSGRVEGDDVVYSVTDNGVGFDMAYKDKLFGVFQRLHTAAEFEGTGIGLALVQRIVQRHGGRVWAEGKVGEGASFYFTLPRGGEG